MRFKRFKNKIYLATPTMHGDEQIYIKEAFDSNWIAPLGKNVDMLEKELSTFIGLNYSTALVSGTAGIHLAVKLAGIKENDIVICSDMTFSATVNPVSYENGRQVFVDIENETWNIDPKALEIAFEKYNGINHPKAKALIIAHLYGTPSKMDEILELCNKYNIILIEDAAESLGASYRGKQTGSFGKYGVISFNGNKIITTSGGGMLLSNSKQSIDKARFWSTQSRDKAPWYQHSELGYNYRMSNIVAGIGRGQLPYLGMHIQKKKEIYMRYREGLKSLPLQMNPYLDYSEPNFWLSCIKIDSDIIKKNIVNPMEIYETLSKYNVESRPLWKPMHLQPYYKNNDFISAENDTDRLLFHSGLCLPSDIKMSATTQDTIIEIIKSCFNQI